MIVGECIKLLAGEHAIARKYIIQNAFWFGIWMLAKNTIVVVTRYFSCFSNECT